MTLYILASALLIMSASLAGIIFINKLFAQVLKQNLKILIAFAAGVFAVLAYSLFSESFELGSTFYTIIVAGILGALTLELATHIIPAAHHHHDPDCDHEHSRGDARRMLLGDGIHNITDGIILVPAFLANVWLGVGTAVGIFLHEFVQEIAEFFVLKNAGYSTWRALTYNFIVSGTILIGIGLALFVSTIENFEAPLLAFAGGSFLYIIFRDLVPSIARGVRSHGKTHQFVLAALVGAILMAGIGELTAHSHEDTEHMEAQAAHSHIS